MNQRQVSCLKLYKQQAEFPEGLSSGGSRWSLVQLQIKKKKMANYTNLLKVLKKESYLNYENNDPPPPLF